ncbi:universal stress protein [Desulfococcus sp.]|uniref:universal stress protein n=1 Tax=Desulfococcus sp. TaxID=2025834 RepID=UPI003593A5D2
MRQSILLALKDSKSSQSVLNYFSRLPFQPDSLDITLLHVFRRPGAGEELMGEDFARKEETRVQGVMENAKNFLIQQGMNPALIRIRLVTDPYPTVTDAIIDQFSRDIYHMVVIGRRKKSKSEEFVMGDVSVKLVRALEGTGVLVVKFI